MPPGAESAESYSDYILGTRDGTPKTPAWAEPICGVPRDTIARLAREYATTKPAMLYQGYGMQRRAYGEQAVRAGCVLAAITGNVGIPGGWAGGIALQAPDGGPAWIVFPTGPNPVKASIPSFLWTEAVLRGKDMTAADGVIGVAKLDTNIKMIYAVACNALVNQHANINRTARILADESLVEFLVVQDNFLTPTGRFADLLLPACTQFETWGLADGWKYGDEVILMPKIVEPPGEAKSDYRIMADIAARLGIGDAYTEGRDERDWVAWSIEQYRKTRFPNIPAARRVRALEHRRLQRPRDQARRRLRRLPPRPGRPSAPDALGQDRDLLQAPPRHGQARRHPGRPQVHPGVGEPVRARGEEISRSRSSATTTWPPSTRRSTTSTGSARPGRSASSSIPSTPKPAASRNGDQVRVFNDRGATRLPCRVTRRILPGVIAIPQGAWWTPDEKGEDTRGSVNVLSSERWTPLAFGNAQHTIMAQVEKV